MKGYSGLILFGASQGEKGLKGPQGPPGYPGDNGVAGQAGQVSCLPSLKTPCLSSGLEVRMSQRTTALRSGARTAARSAQSRAGCPNKHMVVSMLVVGIICKLLESPATASSH